MSSVLVEFERAIERGLFRVPECSGCGAAVWPPSEFCSICLGVVRLGPGYGGGGRSSSNSSSRKGKRLRGSIVECGMEMPAGRLVSSIKDSHSDTVGSGDTRRSFFCLVAFECGIRLVARLAASAPPAPGDPVVLSSCGMNPEGPGYVFEVSAPSAPEDLASPAHM